ncbi:MAG: hypothetical protein HOO94_00790 [Novosphingobium sp.]|uniref:hypothetical protein n=1 Tax=Novosphingobium sp. TaxID=1874826 RepID=UPI001799447F|nr:hypothetical protein [Novosphingobium sp.]
MRTLAIVLGAAALTLGAGAAGARERLSGEAELAKLLEGREAGKPQMCISNFDTRDAQVIDKTALVYRSGNTIWVNRPANADRIDSDDILITYPTSSQFCRLDRVNTMARTGHFMTGFLMLGDFVPYRRIAKQD